MQAPSADCPLTPCIRLLAGAWSLEIMYYLSQGPHRFGQLRRALRGISSKVLTTRLKELEGRGVISRTVFETNPPTVEYALTKAGRELVPVLNTMTQVGKKLKRKYPQLLDAG